MKIKEKKTIAYPRHFWFTCNTFTAYVQASEDLKVTENSQQIVRRFVGKPVKDLVDFMKKKQGGFLYQEYNADGKEIWQ